VIPLNVNLVTQAIPLILLKEIKFVFNAPKPCLTAQVAILIAAVLVNQALPLTLAKRIVAFQIAKVAKRLPTALYVIKDIHILMGLVNQEHVHKQIALNVERMDA